MKRNYKIISVTCGVLSVLLVGYEMYLHQVDHRHQTQLAAELVAKSTVPERTGQLLSKESGVQPADLVQTVISTFLDKTNDVGPGQEINIPWELMSTSFAKDFKEKELPNLEKDQIVSNEQQIRGKNVSLEVTKFTWNDREMRSAEVSLRQIKHFFKPSEEKPFYELVFEVQIQTVQSGQGAPVVNRMAYQMISHSNL